MPSITNTNRHNSKHYKSRGQIENPEEANHTTLLPPKYPKNSFIMDNSEKTISPTVSKHVSSRKSNVADNDPGYVHETEAACIPDDKSNTRSRPVTPDTT